LPNPLACKVAAGSLLAWAHDGVRGERRGPLIPPPGNTPPLPRASAAPRIRRGEAAGLRWCDIDLDHKTAYISWQIQYTGSALVLCPLKTAASKRVLALDGTTVRVLRRYREEQERWYRAHGRVPSGYVFTALDGGPPSPDYLTQTFTQ
jgi:integrase